MTSTKSITAIFAVSILGASLPGYSGEEGVPPPSKTEEHRLTYEALREKALTGGASEKFDAYIYAYEHASKVSDYLPEAYSFLVEAAEQGHTYAQYNLGYLLQSGTWVEQDQSAALSWFLLAARNGNLRAQLWCGIRYSTQYFEAADETGRTQALRDAEY